MISKFIKEGKRYSLADLVNLFSTDEKKIFSAIKKLRETGIVKLVKNSSDERLKHELLEDEEILASTDEEIASSLFVFKFVGIIIVSHLIFKCYPKYIHKSSRESGLKLALKVIEKFEKSSQKIPLFSDIDINNPYNPLATIIYLMNDYNENGFYQSHETFFNSNGEGEINWDRTINTTFAIIKNQRPFYPEVITQKSQFDESNYFKRLHQVVLFQATQILEEADLLDYFNVLPFYDTNEELEDFGETKYILYQLEKEISIQFNTRLQTVLKLLHIYITQKRTFNAFDEVTIYGTPSFHKVWEKVCQESLDNDLTRPLLDIFNITELPKKYQEKDRTLLNLIEKPNWVIENSKNDQTMIEAKGTFIPDCVTVGEEFNIYDAKYYVPRITEKNTIEGQPGINDVSKQFLYQLAYKDIFGQYWNKKINNYFLLPTEEQNNNNIFVSMKMFNNLGLTNIQVKFIDVDQIFTAYLSGEKLTFFQ